MDLQFLPSFLRRKAFESTDQLIGVDANGAGVIVSDIAAGVSGGSALAAALGNPTTLAETQAALQIGEKWYNLIANHGAARYLGTNGGANFVTDVAAALALGLTPVLDGLVEVYSQIDITAANTRIHFAPGAELRRKFDGSYTLGTLGNGAAQQTNVASAQGASTLLIIGQTGADTAGIRFTGTLKITNPDGLIGRALTSYRLIEPYFEAIEVPSYGPAAGHSSGCATGSGSQGVNCTLWQGGYIGRIWVGLERTNEPAEAKASADTALRFVCCQNVYIGEYKGLCSDNVLDLSSTAGGNVGDGTSQYGLHFGRVETTNFSLGGGVLFGIAATQETYVGNSYGITIDNLTCTALGPFGDGMALVRLHNATTAGGKVYGHKIKNFRAITASSTDAPQFIAYVTGDTDEVAELEIERLDMTGAHTLDYAINCVGDKSVLTIKNSKIDASTNADNAATVHANNGGTIDIYDSLITPSSGNSSWSVGRARQANAHLRLTRCLVAGIKSNRAGVTIEDTSRATIVDTVFEEAASATSTIGVTESGTLAKSVITGNVFSVDTPISALAAGSRASNNRNNAGALIADTLADVAAARAALSLRSDSVAATVTNATISDGTTAEAMKVTIPAGWFAADNDLVDINFEMLYQLTGGGNNQTGLTLMPTVAGTGILPAAATFSTIAPAANKRYLSVRMELRRQTSGLVAALITTNLSSAQLTGAGVSSVAGAGWGGLSGGVAQGLQIKIDDIVWNTASAIDLGVTFNVAAVTAGWSTHALTSSRGRARLHGTVMV